MPRSCDIEMGKSCVLPYVAKAQANASSEGTWRVAVSIMKLTQPLELEPSADAK